jgi:hypothetical protein
MHGVKSARMTYAEAIPRLERLLELASTMLLPHPPFEVRQEFALLYGEVHEVIKRFVPDERVEVRMSDNYCEVHPNYIEAGFFSEYRMYGQVAINQLRKTVGKIRQLADSPAVPRDEVSISNVAQTLRRFRECCQYLLESPTNERAVQDIVWVMLRARFERVDREETLPKFGAKSYKPDFGVPEARVLVEVKFIGAKSDIGSLQEEIIADAHPYLYANDRYDSLIVLVYDHAQRLRDSRKFVEDLRTIEQISEVIVIPGIATA